MKAKYIYTDVDEAIFQARLRRIKTLSHWSVIQKTNGTYRVYKGVVFRYSFCTVNDIISEKPSIKQSTLTTEDDALIYELVVSGMLHKDIAFKFDVSKSSISRSYKREHKRRTC